jgi:hypothetical protein
MSQVGSFCCLLLVLLLLLQRLPLRRLLLFLPHQLLLFLQRLGQIGEVCGSAQQPTV